ncbi:MAG: hypothetical protein AAF634_01850, partial [Bacteroidota bacterium]
MNNALVRRQMPLLKGRFTTRDCDALVISKEEMWNEHGFGPWTLVKSSAIAYKHCIGNVLFLK